jgi:hypothetical protein
MAGVEIYNVMAFKENKKLKCPKFTAFLSAVEIV